MLPLLETGKFFELSISLPVSDEKQQIRTKLNSTLVPHIPEISRDNLLFPLSVLAFLSVLPTAIFPILPSQCHLIPEAFPDHFSLKYTHPDSSYLGRERGAFLDPPRSYSPSFLLPSLLIFLLFFQSLALALFLPAGDTALAPHCQGTSSLGQGDGCSTNEQALSQVRA